jgi:hypothetical protein
MQPVRVLCEKALILRSPSGGSVLCIAYMEKGACVLREPYMEGGNLLIRRLVERARWSRPFQHDYIMSRSIISLVWNVIGLLYAQIQYLVYLD